MHKYQYLSFSSFYSLIVSAAEIIPVTSIVNSDVLDLGAGCLLNISLMNTQDSSLREQVITLIIVKAYNQYKQNTTKIEWLFNT
jgi:hypothetical protein